uniref:Uncharacterized protein n=1 Tax=Arundo donax TaxID=35708 RepID=A0A0A9FVN8_ARUDO
MLKDTKIGDQQ